VSLYALADGAAAATATVPRRLDMDLSGQKDTQATATGVVSQATQAIGALASFVPTEIVAMYVAVVPLLGSLNAFANPASKSIALQWWYCVCLVLTVLFYYVVFINQYRAVHAGAYPAWRQIFSRYTTWRAVAAIIAYLVWALAVQSDSARLILCWHFPSCLAQSEIWMGLLIFIVSPLLSALDGLFKT
jgi:hypothetical protein